MAEAVDRVRELGDDRRIDGRVVTGRNQKLVDLRLDGPRELLEHQVLVLHLGAELRCLEQALAIPVQRIDLRLCGGQGGDRRQQPLVQEGEILAVQDHLLGVVDQPVVLGVEDGVDGG